MLADEAKTTTKGFLKNSPMEAAEAEISFDSAISIAPCNWRRWKISETSKLYLKAKKEKILETKEVRKKNKTGLAGAGFSDAVSGGAANDPFTANLRLRNQARAFTGKLQGHGMGGE